MKLINSFEISSFIYFITRYSLVGITINNLILISKQDSYISLVIGFIIGFIPIKIYLYIFNYKPGLNFPELIMSKFNKRTAQLINCLISFFIFVFSITIFWNLTNLINSQYLAETPKLFIGIIFLIPTIYLLLKEISVIAKSIVIIFYISLLLTILPFIGLATQIDITNIYPILDNSTLNILSGSYQYLTFNILPLFLLTIFSKDTIKDSNRLNNRFYKSYLFSNFITFLFLFLTITIFGVKLAQLYQYPEFHLLKYVNIGGFFQRLESTLSIQWIFDIFVINLLSLYYVIKSLDLTFTIKKDKIKFCLIYLVPSISLIGSIYIFQNNTSGNDFFYHTFSHLILLFFLIIPSVLLLVIKFKDLKFNNLQIIQNSNSD